MTRAADPEPADTVAERHRGEVGATHFGYQVGGVEIAARTIARRVAPFGRHRQLPAVAHVWKR